MMQNPYFQTPPVVKNLILINILVFMAEALLPRVFTWMHYNTALYYWGSPNFQPIQLVTHMFMHGGLTHLFFNMFALWMFGRSLEYDLGSKKFLIFYFVCGVGAALMNLGVTWLEISAAGPNEMAKVAQMISTPMVGASGAIFGVLLAFGVLHPNNIIMLMIPPIPIKAKYFVIIYGVAELFFGVTNTGGNIAHFAHVGGMVWGFMLLWWWKRKGKIYY